MCTRSAIFNLKKKVALVMRTMDFASKTGMQYGLFNKDDTGSKNKYAFKAKFSDIGFKTTLGKNLNVRMISDGLNEVGLSLATLWNPASTFDDSIKLPSDCFSGLTLPQKILSNCSSINDVISFFDAGKVTYYDRAIKQKTFKYIGKKRVNIPTEFIQQYATIHLHISDLTGTSYVVEFQTDDDGNAGVPVFYQDPHHTLTNAPDFPWHLTNLRTQVGAMNKFNVTSNKVDDIEYLTTGFGNNWRGVPGDFTPVSRYLRATLMKSAILSEQGSPNTLEQAMKQLDYIKATVQLPMGISVNHGTLSNDVDSTLWTTMHDMFNFEIYQETSDEIGYTKLVCKPIS